MKSVAAIADIKHQHLLSSHYAKHFTYMDSFDLYNNSVRVREVKKFAPDHTANKQLS